MRTAVFKFNLFLFSMVLVGCSSPVKKLEGKWTAGGNMDENHAWYLEYIFNGNNYQLMGYPPLSESGKMRCKEIKGDSMLIEFMVKKSSPHYENHEEWIYITGNTLRLGGNIFTRAGKEKKNK
jgi:hypothetical protein